MNLYRHLQPSSTTLQRKVSLLKQITRVWTNGGMVDDEMDKRVTGADLRNCSTIEELFNLVESK